MPAPLDPVHWHLITNHAPIFLTLAGLIALGLAFISKCGNAKRIALVLIFLGTAAGILTYWLGQEAYKPIRSIADEPGQDLLDLHMERAESIIWLFWLASFAALAAIIPFRASGRVKNVLAILAGILGAASLGASAWIADAGGKIRHSEIRTSQGAPEHSKAMPHEH